MMDCMKFSPNVFPAFRLVVMGLVLGSINAPGEPPAAAGEWQKIVSLTDEFAGPGLDAEKWHDHNPHWKGREPALFSKKNVAIRQGKLHLTARADSSPEGQITYTTAAVKSKALAHYGYFEIRCRAMKSKASSAFWFYQATDERWTEIDVFEMCGRGPHSGKLHTNAHVFRTPESDEHRDHQQTLSLADDPAEKFHVYGLLWNSEWIEWYVDGKRVRKLKNTAWHQPLHMNFDSETFPDWFGLPDPEELPATFTLDYVRSWKLLEKDPASSAR